jgi:hypothetical protein
LRAMSGIFFAPKRTATAMMPTTIHSGPMVLAHLSRSGSSDPAYVGQDDANRKLPRCPPGGRPVCSVRPFIPFKPVPRGREGSENLHDNTSASLLARGGVPF